ncbi:metal ABC transporter ATPase [Burkholderia stagnalis]
MGVGMQIVYRGFAGSAALEAEAAAELVGLERFRALISGCHLAIEARAAAGGTCLYDVRLDLIARDDAPTPLPPCTGSDPCETVRRAFAAAERELTGWLARGGATGGVPAVH